MEWITGILILFGLGFFCGGMTNSMTLNTNQITAANAYCSTNGDLTSVRQDAMHQVFAYCGNGARFEIKEK